MVKTDEIGIDETKLLLVDDEEEALTSLSNLLRRMGYDCITATNGKQALEFVRKARPWVMLTDQKMPQMDGFNLLEEAKKIDSEIVVVIYSGHSNVQFAVRAIQMGAFDYIGKPFPTEHLKQVLDRALKHAEITRENANLRTQIQDENTFEGAVGTSTVMKNIFKQVKQIALTDSSVLISGETGTGKEIIARGIHYYSRRSKGPFVAVDPVALPETVLESEIFGNEKGAFTSAYAMKPGLMEMAKNGTFFLDEISEISAPVQAKFLRVLQELKLRRIGGRELIDVDFRLVSATNLDPDDAVKKGILREDLLYRIKVFHIQLPPLRDRQEDIPLLANHFLRKFNKKSMNNVTEISDEAMEILLQYEWPGNVRQLQNAIEHAVALASDSKICPESLPKYLHSKEKVLMPEIDLNLSFKEAKNKVLQEFVHKYFITLLRKTNGVIAEAARIAQINRKTIYRLIEDYKINLEEAK